MPSWANDFNEEIPVPEKFELLQAADEVQFEGLVEFMACCIAKLYVDMDTKVKAATFALSRDYTPEEEAAVSDLVCGSRRLAAGGGGEGFFALLSPSPVCQAAIVSLCLASCALVASQIRKEETWAEED